MTTYDITKITAYYYNMNWDNGFNRCPLPPWQQFLVSDLIPSIEAHLHCRLHLEVANGNSSM
jgi:hypothetical protein